MYKLNNYYKALEVSSDNVTNYDREVSGKFMEILINIWIKRVYARQLGSGVLDTALAGEALSARKAKARENKVRNHFKTDDMLFEQIAELGKPADPQFIKDDIYSALALLERQLRRKKDSARLLEARKYFEENVRSFLAK